MKSVYLFIIVALTCLTSIAQELRNGNFEDDSPKSEINLNYWKKAWGNPDNFSVKNGPDGKYLQIIGNSENDVGFITQTIKTTSSEALQILEITVDIKSGDIDGRGAGLNVEMYDSAGTLIALKDMGGYGSSLWQTEASDWKKMKIKTICPAQTTSIRAGMILYGEGLVKFDNYTLSLSPVKNQKSSQLAKTFIDSALHIISTNSLYRSSLNYDQLKQEALNISGMAEKPEDCYLAVEYLIAAVRSSGDNHSFFISAEEAAHWANSDDPEEQIEFAKAKMVKNCGYIMIPGFHSGNESLMQKFADSLQNSIRYLNAQNPAGWIVDLRQNTGGNMEPMITGIGPLLDTGKIGWLENIDGKRDHWYYINGKYAWDTEEGISASNPVQLKKKLPIAVLTSPTTGSSGEIVTISFIGNSNTKSFGEPTWGLTTGNGEYTLPDGSKIFLADTRMVDRNGRVYDGRITPDFEITNDGNTDTTLDAAIQSILK